MDELQARHRKEQRDLQSQITQKKKSASKKSRKGVNDECARLEADLKQKQEAEIAARIGSDGDGAGFDDPSRSSETPGLDDDLLARIAGDVPLANQTQSLSIHDDEQDAEAGPQQRKPNRQKARLARRAAEQAAVTAQAVDEAASLPDLRKRERAKLTEEFGKRDLEEKAVAANGHCMYSAIADQIRQLGFGLDPSSEDPSVDAEGDDKELRNEDYKTVRRVAADYIEKNSNDFVPFLEEPLQDYVDKIRDTGEWGGQLELLALAKTYNLKIHVLQGEGRVEEIDSGEVKPRGEAWLAYYRHGFGLGEHYNSLRPSRKSVATAEGA